MQAQATGTLAKEYRLPVDGSLVDELAGIVQRLERIERDAQEAVERLDIVFDYLTGHLSEQEKMEFGKRLWGEREPRT